MRIVAAMKGKEGGVMLREVHPDREQYDEVGREYREQKQPGQERRPWGGVLHGAKPPGGFDALAPYVVPDREENEQADEHVLDDVAQRSGIRGVA